MCISFLFRILSLQKKLGDIYIREVMALHGVTVSVFLDRDVLFTSRFWKRFHEDLGTHLHFNTTFHTQTDGQSEQTLQILEDMLRVYVLYFGGN